MFRFQVSFPVHKEEKKFSSDLFLFCFVCFFLSLNVYKSVQRGHRVALHSKEVEKVTVSHSVGVGVCRLLGFCACIKWIWAALSVVDVAVIDRLERKREREKKKKKKKKKKRKKAFQSREGRSAAWYQITPLLFDIPSPCYVHPSFSRGGEKRIWSVETATIALKSPGAVLSLRIPPSQRNRRSRDKRLASAPQQYSSPWQ